MYKAFSIIKQSDSDAIYVVVLTKESTGTFWNELSEEIAKLNKPNSKVYFDYLFRNGLKNRVFSSCTDEKGICSLSIKPIKDDAHFNLVVFNSFYRKNLEFIQHSRLTTIQKHFFLCNESFSM